MVKEALDKLLKQGSLDLWKQLNGFFFVVLVLKKNGELKSCVNYKVLNKVTNKDQYPLPFCEFFLEEIKGHEIYTFEDG